ncbi:MAG: SDR family NAD(P)-dependent oxidoreductase [Paracoccaceae bacterium]
MTEKTALITGASRGLGYALALALAPHYHIIAVARTVGGLEELDDAIKAKGGQATLAPMDVCTAEAMAQLCRSIYDRWGALDLWAHCAIHAAPLTPVSSIDEKDMAKSINTNITATSRLIPYVSPLLGSEGRAVFFDDTHVKDKFHSSYGATKGAQIAMARSWQTETKNTGPRVDITAPAPMATATRARFYPGEDRSTLTDAQNVAQQIISDLALIP